MSSEMLTPREVADRLRVSPRTVLNWIDTGKLEAVRISPRVTRIPAAAVDALVTVGDASSAREDAAPYCVGCGRPVDPADARPPSDRLRGIIADHREQIVAVAEKYKAENVRLFGSVARGDAVPGSDIDLLVDLRPEATLFDLGGLNAELEELLGCRVDAVPAKDLKAGVRERIISEAVPL
jgi:excisionase family DNA binding protein